MAPDELAAIKARRERALLIGWPGTRTHLDCLVTHDVPALVAAYEQLLREFETAMAAKNAEVGYARLQRDKAVAELLAAQALVVEIDPERKLWRWRIEGGKHESQLRYVSSDQATIDALHTLISVAIALLES